MALIQEYKSTNTPFDLLDILRYKAEDADRFMCEDLAAPAKEKPNVGPMPVVEPPRWIEGISPYRFLL